METAQYDGPTLRVHYCCERIIKDNMEGEILWIGPSETNVLVIETEPRDYLANIVLVDTMKKQIFNSLKQQPYVQALLQEGDTLDVAQCAICYDNVYSWFMGPSMMNQTKLTENLPIYINNDELGPYAELWIAMSLIVNRQKRAHSVPPMKAKLIPGHAATFNCDKKGNTSINDETKAKKRKTE